MPTKIKTEIKVNTSALDSICKVGCMAMDCKNHAVNTPFSDGGSFCNLKNVVVGENACCSNYQFHEHNKAAVVVKSTESQDDEWGPWIEWEGGPCPVPDGSTFHVRFRSGMVDSGDTASEWEWSDNGHPYDIIAYRVKKEAR